MSISLHQKKRVNAWPGHDETPEQIRVDLGVDRAILVTPHNRANRI